MSIKGKDLNTFVRFGGLNSKKQKGYVKNSENITFMEFHSPPASRGVYAFPKCAQELFLLGAMDKFQPGVYPKPPESDSLEKYVDYNKKKRKIRQRIRKEFFKSDDKYIWHHLESYTNRSEIIEMHGKWVKTNILEWKKAFSKMSLNLRYGCHSQYVGRNTTINNCVGIMGAYTKDICEVFFDDI